jgi:hypothetical protein
MVQKCIMGSSGGGGASNDDIKFLLKYSDMCDSESGGWTINNGSEESTGIKIANDYTTNYTAYTVNKINMRGYNKLYVSMQDEGHVYSVSTVNIFSAPLNSFPYPASSQSGYITGADGVSNGVVIIDISSIDEGYVVVGSGTNSSPAYTHIRWVCLGIA